MKNELINVMTVRELADRVGIDVVSMSRYLSGKRAMPHELAEQCLKVMKGRRMTKMNNEQIEAREGLTFRRAWFHMLNGKKVKRPSWKGYWCFENGTIMIYTMEGDIIDIRDTKNVAYTFSNIVENDWMVVEDVKKKEGKE